MSNKTNPPFDLIRIEIAGHPVLVVYGELDALTTPRLHEALEQVIEERPTVVLLDLANVTFLDSTALGTLVVADRHLQDIDRELRIVAVPANVAKVFEITGLMDRFHVYPDADTATSGGHSEDSSSH